MNMKKKVTIFSSLAIAFLLIALTTITFSFNQQSKEEGYKIVTSNIHCEKTAKHCNNCKDCCGIPDCCKDGKCSNGGACCESCCESSSKESAENSAKTDDCCESGASCCDDGACCHQKQQEKQS